jgi:hypothetical protein
MSEYMITEMRATLWAIAFNASYRFKISFPYKMVLLLLIITWNHMSSWLTITLLLMKRTYSSARECMIVSSPSNRSSSLGSNLSAGLLYTLLVRMYSLTCCTILSKCRHLLNSARIRLLWRSHSLWRYEATVTSRPGPIGCKRRLWVEITEVLSSVLKDKTFI